MRVLLTGSSGYVGAVARTVLEAHGHDVVGLDTALYEGCDLGTAPPPPELRLDVRDVQEEHLEGFDAVVHLAALSNDPIGELDEALTYAINHEATARLAELARARGVERFVFASSCSMYGASGSDAAGRRERAARAAHRLRRVEGAERALARRARHRRLLARRRCGSRPPTASRRACASTSCSTTSSAGRSRRAPCGCRATASAWRPLIHVEDMARAIAGVLAAPRDRDPRRGLQRRRLGRELPRPRPRAASWPTSCRASRWSSPRAPAPIRAATGSTSRRSQRRSTASARHGTPARGARQLVDAYRAAGMDDAMFSGDRFVRLSRLKTLIDAGRLDARAALAPAGRGRAGR